MSRIAAWLLFTCTAVCQTPGVLIKNGVAATSGAAWTRVSVHGEPQNAWLTLQCLKTVEGKKRIDLLFEIGESPAFWMPHDHVPTEPPVRLSRLSLTFDAYKPLRREWMEVRDNQFLYNPPGMHSANMEPVDYYLKFMGSVTTAAIFKDRDTSWNFPTQPLIKAMAEQELCRP